MFCRVFGGACTGIDGRIVRVEADAGNGLPSFHIVGEISAEVRESGMRIRTAVKNSGFSLPPKRYLVNLAPSGFRKSGTGFDLPSAVALLCCIEQISPKFLNNSLFIGELSLNGSLVPVRGIDRFGLEPKAKVKALSRGMGMKLQLACALSHKAELLILDEATAGLDPVAREELLDELLSFVADGQHGVLFSSHITSDLERAADRVVCIDNGAIVFDLPREDITDLAGIAHCTQAQAAELLACVDGARAARHTYSVDVLVPNRHEALEAFPEIPCDRATIDDYLRLTLKGASK